MLQKLSYKTKNRLLTAGAFLFLTVVYFSALRQTVSLYSQCTLLEERKKEASQTPVKMSALENELKGLEQLAGKWAISGPDNQQQLLEILSSYCKKEGVSLKEFPRPLLNEQQGNSIETTIFVVEGEFKKLLNLVYELEQKQRAGKVSSVHFSSKQDYKTKTVSLNATIYLQNVIKEGSI